MPSSPCQPWNTGSRSRYGTAAPAPWQNSPARCGGHAHRSPAFAVTSSVTRVIPLVIGLNSRKVSMFSSGSPVYHEPSREIYTGVTLKPAAFVASMHCSAETIDTSCSQLREPKNTAIFILLILYTLLTRCNYPADRFHRAPRRPTASCRAAGVVLSSRLPTTWMFSCGKPAFVSPSTMGCVCFCRPESRYPRCRPSVRRTRG